MLDVNLFKNDAGYCELRCDFGTIVLRNWRVCEIEYRNSLVQVVKAVVPSGTGIPKDVAGPCAIVLGYVGITCAPLGSARWVDKADERKELSDLLCGFGNVLFSCMNPQPRLYQKTFDFPEKG